MDQCGSIAVWSRYPVYTPPIPGPAVRQDYGGALGSMDQPEKKERGNLAQFWAFRFTASKVNEEQLLKTMDMPWIKGYGYQKEKGKKRDRVEHYQGTFECEPRKRFKALESHFKNDFEELVFDGRDYLKPSRSEAANMYGMKVDTRVGGPWYKGERYEEIAKQTVYKVEIELRPWQKKVCEILDGPPDDRSIYWLWEPYGGLGKTTFLKWIYQNYKNVMVSGGKSHDMKNGVVRYREGNGDYPKIVLINLPKTFNLDYFSATGVEEVKDMFFYSGKYGGKDEDGQVCGPPPKVIIMANKYPPIDEMATDRWKIRRLPDGAGKEVSAIDDQCWDE